MSVLFYIDGEEVVAAKAKACYTSSVQLAVVAGYCSSEDAASWWAAKAKSEEARERIQEITCFDFGNLEVIIEE